MSPHKRLMVSACALFIMLGFLGVGVFMSVPQKEVTETFAEDRTSPSAPQEDPLEDKNFTLKIQDGVLVVFSEADDIRPLIVTDIYASTLRHSDRQMLERGIVANGEVELLTLLEDFSS